MYYSYSRRKLDDLLANWTPSEEDKEEDEFGEGEGQGERQGEGEGEKSVSSPEQISVHSKTCYLRSLFWTSTYLLQPLFEAYLLCNSLDFTFIFSSFVRSPAFYGLRKQVLL